MGGRSASGGRSIARQLPQSCSYCGVTKARPRQYPARREVCPKVARHRLSPDRGVKLGLTSVCASSQPPCPGRLLRGPSPAKRPRRAECVEALPCRGGNGCDNRVRFAAGASLRCPIAGSIALVRALHPTSRILARLECDVTPVQHAQALLARNWFLTKGIVKNILSLNKNSLGLNKRFFSWAPR